MTTILLDTPLSDCIRIDHAFAERPPRVRIPGVSLERVEWYCVINHGAKRPRELKPSQYHESAIHLPPTRESLVRIQRAFRAYRGDCSFGDLKIAYCENKIDMIVFFIRTPIKPKEH